MAKFIIAAGVAGVIIVISGVGLSLALADVSRSVAAKFTFEMAGPVRFAFHVALRLLMGAAITTLIYFLAASSKEIAPFLLVVTAAWIIAYIPSFLLLADLAVIPLRAAAITIVWGWGEFAVAGFAAWRILAR